MSYQIVHPLTTLKYSTYRTLELLCSVRINNDELLISSDKDTDDNNIVNLRVKSLRIETIIIRSNSAIVRAIPKSTKKLVFYKTSRRSVYECQSLFDKFSPNLECIYYHNPPYSMKQYARDTTGYAYELNDLIVKRLTFGVRRDTISVMILQSPDVNISGINIPNLRLLQYALYHDVLDLTKCNKLEQLYVRVTISSPVTVTCGSSVRSLRAYSSNTKDVFNVPECNKLIIEYIRPIVNYDRYPRIVSSADIDNRFIWDTDRSLYVEHSYNESHTVYATVQLHDILISCTYNTLYNRLSYSITSVSWSVEPLESGYGFNDFYTVLYDYVIRKLDDNISFGILFFKKILTIPIPITVINHSPYDDSIDYLWDLM